MIFDKKNFVLLFIGFLVSTIVGTLSHEFGHYTVARILGYEAKISYGSVKWMDEQDLTFIRSSWKKYHTEIKAKKEFPWKSKLDDIYSKFESDGFWIGLGGPLQTIITGTFGLIFLIIFKNRFLKVDNLSKVGWLLVFLTLFWLRQTANLFVGIASLIMTGKTSTRSDEAKLDLHLNFPLWTIEIVTGSIGMMILVYVIFNIIPNKQRLTFLLAGIFGGISGYILWLKTLGPIIMP
jgi:hypothetical protein